MTLHVGALFTQDAGGRMLRINEPDGRGGLAPRFFLGQTLNGLVIRYRADVGADCQRELQEASERIPHGADRLEMPLNPDLFCAILERDAPVRAVERGPAFVCPQQSERGPHATFIMQANAECLLPLFPD